MKINLSERMQKIAEMVIPGESCADIGTDHGYIPAYLLQNNICSKVVLTDIAEGPLERARKNLTDCGLEAQDFRLGAGLEVLDSAEVSTVIIAGMGGELIRDILLKDPAKSKSFRKLILQPRTRTDEMRRDLALAGFTVCDYALARERGRICEIIALRPGTADEAEENFIISDFLLRKKDPLLKEFIEIKIKQRKDILKNLQNSEEDQTKKSLLLEEEIHYLKNLL